MRWWVPVLGIVLAWVLALVVACGPGRPLPEINPDGTAITKFVVGLSVFMSDNWRNSAYYRSADPIMEWPVYVALAADGTGCIVSGEVMTVLHYGDRLVCVDGWRLPRPTH